MGMAHTDEFEKQFAFLRQPGSSMAQKWENYEKNVLGPNLSANLEFSSDSNEIYLKKPIYEMTREEAVLAAYGIAHSKTSRRSELMESLIDRAQLPQRAYSQMYAAQLDPRKTERINLDAVLESLNDPDRWGSRKAIEEKSVGRNEVTIRDGGVFADIGVATLRHDSDLKRALKCAVQGDERGLKQALRASMHVRNNYSSQLREIADGKLTVTSETLKVLGITDQSASNTVIDGDTGDVEGDPYGGQFRSDWWR